jgi:hypothetical protein
MENHCQKKHKADKSLGNQSHACRCITYENNTTYLVVLSHPMQAIVNMFSMFVIQHYQERGIENIPNIPLKLAARSFMNNPLFP